MSNRIFWERYVNNLEDSEGSIGEENVKVAPMAISPHGLVPLSNPMLYTKHFDMWDAHTNFDVTEDMVFAIDKIPGVEVLLPLTRYSFRIGFKTKARLFNLEDVKYDIEAFCGSVKDEMSSLTIQQRNFIRKEKNIVSNFPYWAIFVFPNGQVYSVSSDKKSDEYIDKIKTMKDTKDKIGGIFLESDYVHLRRIQNGTI